MGFFKLVGKGIWKSAKFVGKTTVQFIEYSANAQKAEKILNDFSQGKKNIFDKYGLDFDTVVAMLVENNYDLDKTILEINEDDKKLLKQLEIYKLKKNIKRTKAREEAEKEVYGRVRSERTPIKNKEEIFRKFENKCVICGEVEGLHIHHKDKNPSNNVSDNLLVLCGVCHKKIHMKVR
jgi:antitoxin component of RelBE/YafQ-DinJ toxin-antitoxin module